MAYCEYCGGLIPEGASYCSNCGAPAPIVETISTSASSVADPVMQQGTGDYSLVLVSLGTCARAAASDLLEDVLGYTPEQASDLFDMIPAQAAQQLSYEQAIYLAKAMTEYGMEVSVRNGSNYISLDDTDTDSVFDSAGSFLKKAATVLGMITGLNRMRKFRKLEERRYYEKPFRRVPSPAQPPKHVRRNIKPVSAVPPTHHQTVRPDAPHDFRQKPSGSARNMQTHDHLHQAPGNHHRNDGHGRGPGQMPR